MEKWVVILLITFVSLVPRTAAAEPLRIDLSYLAPADAKLAIDDGEGNHVLLSTNDIEKLDTYSLETTTPWRDEPAVFSGVLLSDLLLAYGLYDRSHIRIVAENDYQVTMPREIWSKSSIMLATRVDGSRISRRERGPIQIVVDSVEYSSSDTISESHLVWMLSEISSFDE